MAAAGASNGEGQPSSAASQQQHRAVHRSKRQRTDQPQEPASTTTVLSTTLLHIPASTPTTQPARPHDTTHVDALPSSRIQQLTDGLLLFPAPAAAPSATTALSLDPLLLLVPGPTLWTGQRAFRTLPDFASLLPHDFISRLHHAALTTPPITPLTSSTFVTPPPIAALASSSSAVLLVDKVNQTVMRLRRERRVLMAGMARDARLVSAYVRGSSGGGETVDTREREAGSSAGVMLESAVRRLGEVNDQLTLLSALAVVPHKRKEAP